MANLYKAYTAIRLKQIELSLISLLLLSTSILSASVGIFLTVQKVDKCLCPIFKVSHSIVSSLVILLTDQSMLEYSIRMFAYAGFHSFRTNYFSPLAYLEFQRMQRENRLKNLRRSVKQILYSIERMFPLRNCEMTGGNI